MLPNNRRRNWIGATAVVAVLFGVMTASADTVQLGPSKDNTLYESTTGSLSNGIGESFFAGRTAQPRIRRGLIAFDVGEAIPAGSTINSVRLTLHLSQTVSGPQPIGLHRVLADWGEGSTDANGGEGGGGPTTPGSATWVHRFSPDLLWATVGGHFAATSSASIFVNVDEFNTWGSTLDLAADVQDWLDDPSNNFGWILIGNESVEMTAKRFDTREHLVPEFRPVLSVEFEPPPPSNACCFPGGGCEDLPVELCKAVGGLPQGVGTSCANTECGNPAPFIVHEESASSGTSPCSGYVDPRIENLTVGGGLMHTLGLDRVRLLFSEPVFAIGGGNVDMASFAISHTASGPAPAVTMVTQIDPGGTQFEVRINPLAALQHWTTIQAIVEDGSGQPIENVGNLGPGLNEPDRVDVAAHPGNIDQNAFVQPLDLLRFRQRITNTCATCPSCGGDHLYYDVDRNGLFIAPLDLLRLRQILTGAPPTTRPWSQPPHNMMLAAQP